MNLHHLSDSIGPSRRPNSLMKEISSCGESHEIKHGCNIKSLFSCCCCWDVTGIEPGLRRLSVKGWTGRALTIFKFEWKLPPKRNLQPWNDKKSFFCWALKMKNGSLFSPTNFLTSQKCTKNNKIPFGWGCFSRKLQSFLFCHFLSSFRLRHRRSTLPINSVWLIVYYAQPARQPT